MTTDKLNREINTLGWHWDNSYNRLPESLFQRVEPARFERPTLVGNNAFADGRHFFRVAAEAMRQILIDRARRKQRLRHGGGRQRVALSDVDPAAEMPVEELLAMNVALDRFSQVEPVKAELVKLRYFAGLTEEGSAAALGISRPAASRYWSNARAWLIHELDEKRE